MVIWFAIAPSQGRKSIDGLSQKKKVIANGAEFTSERKARQE